MPSQSALLTMRAALRRGVEVEKPLELRADAGDVLVDLLARQQHRAPATCRSDRRSCRCRRRRSRSACGRSAADAPAPSPVSSEPTCRLDAVGSKPMYAVTRSVGEQVGQSLGGVVHHAAPREFVVEIRHRRSELLYQPMAVSRRAVLKGPVADSGVGARRPAPARTGFSTSATQLAVTRADRAASPACRRRSPACASACSPTSTAAAGCRTTTSRAPSSALMAEQPDLIVLGGDYVTWGDRDYVEPVRRGAGAALGAARRLRHPRQSRRRPRHAGGARRRAASRC